MSMTDPIADFLTRIRNASNAKHRRVDIPASKMKREMARILFEHGFIKNYILIDDGKQGIIRIYLKYDESEQPVISGLQRVSRPGFRKYVGVKEIPRVYNNFGIAILSTPRGILTDRDARKLNVGGEILCYVW